MEIRSKPQKYRKRQVILHWKTVILRSATFFIFCSVLYNLTLFSFNKLHTCVWPNSKVYKHIELSKNLSKKAILNKLHSNITDIARAKGPQLSYLKNLGLLYYIICVVWNHIKLLSMQTKSELSLWFAILRPLIQIKSLTNITTTSLESTSHIWIRLTLLRSKYLLMFAQVKHLVRQSSIHTSERLKLQIFH